VLKTNLVTQPPAPLVQPEVPGPDSAPPPVHRLWQPLKFDYTWLPGGGSKGLEINDVELSATLNLPFSDQWAPLLITPGFAGHFWEGPHDGRLPDVPDLPHSLYDAYLDIGWRPRLARWLFADLGVIPGVYSDFKDVNANAFQMRGRGLAIVAFSPQCQVAAGVLYVNRNKVKVLPAGGLIWNPDEDTHLLFLFPQPKLSRRILTTGATQWWAYLGGEFGGGRWSVERADGSIDLIDYTDSRVLLGLEWLVPEGVKAHLEVGYAFGRKVNFTSDTPDYKPDSTVLLRAGIGY
jgi:hypothetical protein